VAPDLPLPAPVSDSHDEVPGTVEAPGTANAVTDVVDTTPPVPAPGDAVVATTPSNDSSGGTTVVRDSLRFEPPTGKSSGATGSGPNGPGTAISSVAKGFIDAVKSALGGASTDDTGE
jgi:hypothetical protein